MFINNLKTLRKAKGFTQEELAIRLHVVRQTVSKWEKGLSVPDAELLIRLADVLETPVSTLLGDSLEDEKDTDAVALQLSRINEQLAIKNRRARRVWKTVGIIFIAFVALNILLIVASILGMVTYDDPGQMEITTYEEGPQADD